MKKKFINKKFSWGTELVIDEANTIIDEYQHAGMTLTLRQLYYQFVSRDLLENKQKEYSRLGRILSDARMAGEIDWDAIEDRTRNIKKTNTWTDPGEIIKASARSFKLDHWSGQGYYIEVWIEKEALIGVIDSVCRDLHVGWFACKGYVSKSEMYASARRMRWWGWEEKKQPIIIHLGDHDPSGIDMTRDIFAQHSVFKGAAEVKRIALNMDQIEKYNPPPNPTKLTDSRSTGYIEKYGMGSWELDALDPKMMQKLVKDTILQYRDQHIYQGVIEQEAEYKNILNKVAENWREL